MLHHLLRARISRALAVALVGLQVLSAVPLAAAPRGGSPVPAPQEPPTAQANRTVPEVAPPASVPTFSATPSVDEIFRAQVFAEPLVPVGGLPTAEENAALAQAILAYHQHGDVSWVAPFGIFLTEHPQSAWRASLLVNLASAYRQSGAFGRAIEAADGAWELSKDATDVFGRAVADLAAAESITIAAMFGQVDVVRSRSEAIAGRSVRGPAAARIARAKETASLIADYPTRVIPSGPEALRVILTERDGIDSPTPAVLKDYVPSAAGVSLAELATMAPQADLQMRAVKRVGAQEVPVPSVIHWKLGHYSPVVERQGDRYRLVDVALGGTYWIARDTLLDEGSGYWLIPESSGTSGWMTVTATEAAAVIGHSCPPGGPPPAPPNPPPPPCPPGMPIYYFGQVKAALLLADQPTTYGAPKGPDVTFRLVYDHREETQPQIFTSSNLGPMWTFKWNRFIQEEQWCTQTCNAQIVWAQLEWGGREVSEAPDAQGVYPAHWYSKAVITRTSTNPLQYERRLPDGTVEVYGLPNAAPAGQRRVFLTQVVDPQGQAISLTWDAQFRLTAVTDAIGQVSTFSYEDPADALRITKVTDPYGRYASLTYTDAGQLASVTDTLGLTSTFAYQDGDFIASMTTPYGTSTFRHEADPLERYTYRFIEASDPLGGTERAEYRYDEATVAETVPSAEVPAGFTEWNQRMNMYTSYYWDKRAWAPGDSDLSTATAMRWMTKPEYTYTGTAYSQPVLHSLKKPLEGRVWFKYNDADPIRPNDLGSYSEPTVIARVLDDGTTQAWEREYDTNGNVLTETDPLGRQASYTYATNGIDLLEVRQTTGALNDLLASYSNYTTQHRPQTIVDEGGQTTTATYNSAGQPLTVTNAKSETTTLGYDTDGRLTGVTGPVSGASITLAYDGYGRVRTRTGVADGYSTTIDYDVFDRPIRVTYPDASYEATTYNRLDVATRRDRLGRITRYFYNALRRLTAVRDPLGRTISQEWCNCGSLSKLTDANGHATSWERDLQARVTREVRADGTTATVYTYDPVAGRLKTITDPVGQVKTYTYDGADDVTGIAYTNATIATPSVTFTYDTSYPRVATMVDGIGTTTYAYVAAGQVGGGQVGSIDGPRTDDTLTYTYDELGRVTNRALNNVGATWAYDNLGRLTSEVNPLGTFSYTYDGATQRLASATYPNGQASLYSYFGNSGDRRLQMIHHQLSGGATLSKFDYTYDVVGNILTWEQQADADAATKWTYGYDAADQLTAAIKRTTDPTPTVIASYGYRYDAGGNRTAEQVGDIVTGATHDALNRLVAHTPAGVLRIAGTLNEAGTVTIDGQPAAVDASQGFVGSKPLAAGTNTFEVTATDASGNSQAKTFEVDADGDSKTFTYDANGNMTGDGTRTFEWDAENRLVAVNIGIHRSEFTYDGFGRRVRIIEKESGSTTRDAQLFWAGLELIEERLSTGEINRFFEDGEQHDGVARYLTRDHLGSVREVTDASGAVITRNDYDPYGRVTRLNGNVDSRFGYTGHYSDSPSGLVLAPYRAYDPTLGRWLTEDPIGRADGPNLYSYVNNRSISALDPFGLWGFASEYGTSPAGLREGIKAAEPTVDSVFNDLSGHDSTVTYTTNGTHKKGSRHYTGDAVDLRTRNLTKEQRAEAARRLRQRLGPDYDVIDEGDHIHVEYDPKGKKQNNPGPRGAISGWNSGDWLSNLPADDSSAGGFSNLPADKNGACVSAL